jgi:hypothetical protein
MSITTEEAERLADRVECVIGVGEADAIRSLAAERVALQAENARLRKALRLAIDAIEFWTADLQKLRAALGEKE